MDERSVRPPKGSAGRKRVSTLQDETFAQAGSAKAGEAPAKKKSAIGESTVRKVATRAVDAVADDEDDVARDAIALARDRAGPVVNYKRSALERLDDPPPAPLSTLLSRVSRAIERELTQIEVIIGGARVNPRQRTEGERRARTLASLARTLREVMHLRAGEEKTRQDDDALPRDIDELRHQLARRLDQLVAEAKAAHPGEAE